ncbi:MAG: hypothetical protein JSW11_06775 [Candidatus Heimdallarchaeota archaeon]|nr:MAG: hypothetical protein JSW11_06775 [Candidatus Heimdallarchaeota archaeon]
MKRGYERIFLILVFTLCLVAAASINVAADKVSNPEILIHNGSGAYHRTGNITDTAEDWGYEVTEVKSVNDSILKGVDILILNANDLLYTNESGWIKDWWDDGYSKTVWVAGDSDYGGYFKYGPLNELLVNLGGHMILQDDAISDPESNDEAAYRVISNVTNSEYNDNLTKGVSLVVTHSPCPVAPYDGGVNGKGDFVTWDSLATADWLLNSSPAAQILDQDFDDDNIWEGYPPLSNGSVTTLGIEWGLGSEKLSKLIVSGEAIYSDGEAMFADKSENAKIDIDTIKFVKALLEWGTPEAAPGAVPGFTVVPFFLALGIVVVIVKKRR